MTDAGNYPAHLFKSLYHLRWGVEEDYKRLKQWLVIENFSGKSSLSVQQDFHAKIVATNLTASMTLGAQKTTAEATKHLNHHYQINFAQALSKIKHRIAHLVLNADRDIKLLYQQNSRSGSNRTINTKETEKHQE